MRQPPQWYINQGSRLVQGPDGNWWLEPSCFAVPSKEAEKLASGLDRVPHHYGIAYQQAQLSIDSRIGVVVW